VLLERRVHVHEDHALLLEILANSILVCGAVSLWFLFFRRSRAFPRAYIALALYGICINVFDSAAVHLLPESVRESDDMGETVSQLFRSLAWTGIWAAYLLKSRRVRETFVFPWAESPEPEPETFSAPRKDTASP